MEYFRFIPILILCLLLNSISAQEMQLTSKDSIVSSSWHFGLGYTFIDDSATPFGRDFLAIKETWNALPYPTRMAIGRSFSNGFGVEAAASYNRYKIGKKVDGEINLAERDYYAFDGLLKYDLNMLFEETSWFDPYVQAGLGYSNIGSLGRATANGGFGFNTWFTDTWGLNFNTMGKWGIGEGITKQLQHSAGVVYRFGIEKELSKKGIDQLALIEAINKEQQRVQDSTETANRAEELAKRLAEELEASRLAAAEKARIEAENERKLQIEKEIEGLGNVYFAFNSYTLNNDSKVTLNKLSDLLNVTPSIILEVSSYTDSRGTDTYNLALSNKRVQRTIDYLNTKGITKDRLNARAFGELELINECDNNTPCVEFKHRLNRRSEFKVFEF
jgi:OOP family OmpA-OmpF porin